MVSKQCKAGRAQISFPGERLRGIKEVKEEVSHLVSPDWGLGLDLAGRGKLSQDETREKSEGVQVEKKRDVWYEAHAGTEGRRLHKKGVRVSSVGS